MIGVAFIVAVVAVVAAVVFWFQSREATGVVKALRDEADAAKKEAESARADARKAADEVKARSAQLQETREKLVDARKKAQDQKGAKVQSRGAREAELEEDLAHARKLTEEAHAAEAAARRDLANARGAEAQAKAELAAAQTRIRELSNRPAPVAAAAPVAAPSPDTDAQRVQLEAARSELERQVQQAERNARDAKKRESDLREEVKKHKGRAETNNRVYLITKGELEVTRERLAQAERKLWQAGIPLAPQPSKERPKAVGPAAADRPRESGAAVRAGSPGNGEANGEKQDGAALAGPVATAPAGEPIASAPESLPTPAQGTPPAGVAPIRRRASETGAEKPEG